MLPWQNGTVQNQQCGKCGAPWAIDKRGVQWLQRCVRVNKHATVEQRTIQINQGATNSISSMTAQRTLLHMGLHSRCLVNAPMLTLLVISNEGSNLYVSTAIGGPLSDDWWLFPMNQFWIVFSGCNMNMGQDSLESPIADTPREVCLIKKIQLN